MHSTSVAVVLHGRVLHTGARAAAMRAFLAGAIRRLLMRRDGIPADQLHHADTFKADAANSLKVYRANVFPLRWQRADATTTSTFRCS